MTTIARTIGAPSSWSAAGADAPCPHDTIRLLIIVHAPGRAIQKRRFRREIDRRKAHAATPAARPNRFAPVLSP